ncbi:hypothetical protein [Bacillus pumilus]|nr:hypothetical protein [Bacillus pumilus]
MNKIKGVMVIGDEVWIDFLKGLDICGSEVVWWDKVEIIGK